MLDKGAYVNPERREDDPACSNDGYRDPRLLEQEYAEWQRFFDDEVVGEWELGQRAWLSQDVKP